MASEENRRELEVKVTALVAARFGGDYKAAFDHYDTNGDGFIGQDELKVLLVDAGVGNSLTRWAWAAGIVAELDTDHDGAIAWSEFSAVFERNSPA